MTENLDPGPSSPLIEVTGSIAERQKKTPRPERFRAKKGNNCINYFYNHIIKIYYLCPGYSKDVASTPTSPNKDSCIKIRESFSEPTSDDSG